MSDLAILIPVGDLNQPGDLPGIGDKCIDCCSALHPLPRVTLVVPPYFLVRPPAHRNSVYLGRG